MSEISFNCKSIIFGKKLFPQKFNLTVMKINIFVCLQAEFNELDHNFPLLLVRHFPLTAQSLHIYKECALILSLENIPY